VAPHCDDAVNSQNYKTVRRLLSTVLLADEVDVPADDDEKEAEETSADAAERTGWKTGPASDTQLQQWGTEHCLIYNKINELLICV